jgi:hypothetical protein
MNPNLVIIGTRSRPDNAIRAFQALKKTSIESDFLIVINEDQQELYPEINGVQREVVPTSFGANEKGNHVVHKYWDSYKTITGIDDDCLVQTTGWDAIITAPIKQRGYGISYGNDGMQGSKIPTKVTISSNIVKSLGFFSPPILKHSFCDNFWKILGESLNALDYFKDVNMEHLHWINGKAPKDKTYEMNTKELFIKDKKSYFNYIENDFEKDLMRVKKDLGL